MRDSDAGRVLAPEAARPATMEKPADFSIRTAERQATVALAGDWTAATLGDAPQRLGQAVRHRDELAVDIRRVRGLDTAGAFALLRVLGPDYDLGTIHARPESRRLLDLVGAATRVKPVIVPRPRGFHEMTVRIGKGVVETA